MKEPYEKISPTAKFVAYLRTFTDIPFAKEMAEESGAEKTYQELAGESEESLLRLSPYWEARYRATDRIIMQCGITQILEVAAGLSPRGIAMTENPNVVYVVTDLPQILEQEKAIAVAILSRLNSERLNLHFETANALHRDNLLRAATVFVSDRPVAIITEGLLPYLNREEKSVLADNIHEVLRRSRGVWIASDVHTKQFRRDTFRLDEMLRQRQSRIAAFTGSDLDSNLFADENELEGFFRKSGFQIEEYQYSSVVQELSSPRKLNLAEEDMKRVFELLSASKTLVLTPCSA